VIADIFRSPILAITSLMALASACGGRSDMTAPATAAPVTPNVAIVTDSLSYTLVGYGFVLGMVYTNMQPDTMQIATCPGYLTPELQRWSGTAWETALEPNAVPCSVPVTVAPLGQYREMEQIHGSPPPSHFTPVWSRVDPSGTYRAVYNIHHAASSRDSAATVPIEQRVSNNFTLRLP
jgi:hypothetical protein